MVEETEKKDEINPFVLAQKRGEAASMMRQLAQKLCKNASLRLVEETDKHKNINILAENDGCKNERRNGSAYCHACSDAFHDLQRKRE